MYFGGTDFGRNYEYFSLSVIIDKSFELILFYFLGEWRYKQTPDEVGTQAGG